MSQLEQFGSPLKTPRLVPIDQIDLLTDKRVRCKVREATVEEYTEAMNEGSIFPPGTSFMKADGRHLLADGEHRYLSIVAIGGEKMELTVYDNNRENAENLAVEYAMVHNAHHGLKMTNHDKHNAIKLSLSIPRLHRMSARKLAGMLGVSPGLVDKIRSGEPMEKKAPKDVAVGAHKRTAPGAGDSDNDPAEVEEDSIEQRTRAMKQWIKEDKLDWQTCLEVLDASYKDATFFRIPKKDGKIIVVKGGKEKEIAVKEATYSRGRITLFVETE